MSYKTILVHIDDTSRSPTRIQLAAELALKYDAHLMGLADTGITRFIYQDGNINGIDPGLLPHLEHLRERAAQNVADFKVQVARLGVTSFSSEITQDDASGGISLRARYCDLIVLGQTNPQEPSPSVIDDFPESMILDAGRPVIVVPNKGEFSQTGGIGMRPLVAWDASRAATRAVTDAIPFLQKAELVQVVILNPTGDVHGEQPGADISAYLARHGVKLEVSVQHTKEDIGSALLTLATDLKSDLMVMGGYGHSRFTEMIMGGTTRSVLKNMSIPILFAH